MSWSGAPPRDESEETGQMNAHDKEQIRLYFESLPLSLQMKDGSTLDLSNAGGSIDPQEGKTVCQKSNVFSSILDLSQVESNDRGGRYHPRRCEIREISGKSPGRTGTNGLPRGLFRNHGPRVPAAWPVQRPASGPQRPPGARSPPERAPTRPGGRRSGRPPDSGV